MAIKLVVCYAHEDKAMHDELRRHLISLERQQRIVIQSDKEINAGSVWKEEINAQLKTAQIILLLVSSDFMASEHCYSVEMTHALERHHAGLAQVIPIIVRPVDWENAPFQFLKALPEYGHPVTQWRDHDSAWREVVQGIQRVIVQLEAPPKAYVEQRPAIGLSTIPNKGVIAYRQIPNNGKPTVDQPMLICLAIDVSDSMKKPIIDHTGKTIRRWASVSSALEHFVQLGVSWIQDPETQKVHPLYHLMAYGFGFKEVMYAFGRRKQRGGPVRDLLAHPDLPSLPSVSDLSKHWADYKNHLLSQKAYTGDLFGSTPMRQALVIIRDRIREERKKKIFAFPVLLLIISDGIVDEKENPLFIIEELHSLGVITLSCYLADEDVVASRRLYRNEESYWSSGAKLMFRCASPLHQENYVTEAMFDYLSDHEWKPQEGSRLFIQVNHAQGLEDFLKVLLTGAIDEKRA